MKLFWRVLVLSIYVGWGWSYCFGQQFRVRGSVLDGGTLAAVTNVEVQLVYVPLNSTTNDLTSWVATNTDASGSYSFDLPGESEGHARIVELPASYVTPMKETFRVSSLNPTNVIVFRVGSAAALSGTITTTNGSTDLTKFLVEINATEVNAASNGAFFIEELPASQQTMRLVYQDGLYFDDRVVNLPTLSAGVTNSVSISWFMPRNNLAVSGVLHDALGNVLSSAKIQFLGKSTGVFVGMQTDANGNYAFYDLPSDCYAVRAFVGRYGLEQRNLSSADATYCTSTNSSSGAINGWWKFNEGSGTLTANSGADGSAGNATLTNNAAFNADAPNGTSVRLPSSGSGGSTPAMQTSVNYDPLGGATKFTLAAWVKRESSNISSNTAARIISDIDSLGATANGFEFRFSGTNGLLTFNINGTERNTTVGGVSPTDGTWHHVAVVYDGTRPATNTLTRHVHFYVDAVQKGDGNTLAGVTVGSNTNNLTIGNSSVSRSILNTLVGKIDNVRVYKNFAPDAVGSGKTNSFILSLQGE